MKKIEAIIRPFKLNDIKDELLANKIEGMTISDVKGYGHTPHKEVYRGNEFNIDFVAKVKIEVVVSNETFLNTAIEVIKKYAHTGKIGDGKIFVYDVVKVIRIRTGEESTEAL